MSWIGHSNQPDTGVTVRSSVDFHIATERQREQPVAEKKVKESSPQLLTVQDEMRVSTARPGGLGGTLLYHMVDHSSSEMDLHYREVLEGNQSGRRYLCRREG